MLLPIVGQAAPVARLTAAELGGIESAVSFCEKVDPNDTALRRKAQELMKGLSEDRIEEMKRTADYKNAYTTLTGILLAIPKAEGVGLCMVASK